MFIKILKQHLTNISKMRKGITPDYGFLKTKSSIPELELSVGSINKFTHMYSVYIDLKDDYLTILAASKKNIQNLKPLNRLRMKYWTHEINPDFVSEASHIKLDKTLTLEEGQDVYPPCIKTLMKLKYKGNYNRFLLARYLLAVHKKHDAKFLFNSVLGTDELDHVKNGNDSGQWRYIANNTKRYDCPSCKDLHSFCSPTCQLKHPLEKVQELLIKKEKDEEDTNGNE